MVKVVTVINHILIITVIYNIAICGNVEIQEILQVCCRLTWSTIPSRAESSVGWRSRSRCMILLHRHRDTGARMGADSPWGVPPPTEAPPILLLEPDEAVRLSVEEEEGPRPVGVAGGRPLP